ncbi:6-phosphofructokinase [Yamadazyma tenuis ATCC 10573]|uniref:ATP-dependent 6-phosphofructokinase n=2 Tax=Candida tenuis TaxID=2315449 RepID=G3B045_CANTC|nr:uncharacterized protein CANTEDRAFT_119542 [Yamadazyma tenuis ATCC 10573]XP_006685000.1 6-phosphofructokinase [Yamadazyma tenuis ATCC 10573]EGV65313.1 hypothetical protein CANTEDRAFT_119542 [Yamadazyma tenuis ATCC 10573]EGV65314.1 6-phosphofructokinase [Yamadazyma tenuis ATCC 10573]
MTIEGLSSISLVTDSPDKFTAAAKFYVRAGFTALKSYNKHLNKPDLLGVSSDSIRELWLQSFPVEEVDSHGQVIPFQESAVYQGDNCESLSDPVLIKLRLVSTCVEVCKDIHLFTTDVDGCHRRFGSSVDPLGNRIVLSNKESLTGREFGSDQEYIDYRKSVLVPASNDADAHTGPRTLKKKIAVMTSGGDSQGMNPAVRAVVRSALFYGCDAFAVYEGYEGLVNDYIRRMDWDDVRSFLSFGGTNIGTARSKRFRDREGRLEAAGNMIKNGIDALVVCGGDGSLTGADLFRSEWPSLVDELVSSGRFSATGVAPYRHLTIVGLVGSIDNDMATTDATIGAFSSLERITEMVDYIDATATSHSRAFVVEVMGRHCGWLGLMAGLATGADYIFIPERPPKNGAWQAELQVVARRHREAGKRNTTVIVAEGATDDQLNPITAAEVKDVLVDLGLDTRITTLGHVQRGGSAVAFDRMLGTVQGVEAVKAVLESTPASESPMIAIVGNKIVRQPLMKAVALTKSVAECIEAKDFDGAMALRDGNFAEAYDQFLHTSIHDDGTHQLPTTERLNIGVIHIGASSSALNASTRAITLYCLSRGHKVFAIQNGFHGLIHTGEMRELEWIDVEGWYNKGGSEIGTNRSLPSENYGEVAYHLQKNSLDGLIIIGGFESFTALNQLNQQRHNYPVFRMPMIVIPATVSNNVPGTEYSLGCDTCLNQLVNYCDAVKQSASSTRRRVFVVEVQGGHSGFVASFIGLVTGSIATYTPEKKINLATIQEDIDLIFKIFENDRGEDKNGKIIIRNELSSKVYTTELISEILKENSNKRFETRTAVPGHVQQGFKPTSKDRVFAVNFGMKAVQFLEEHQDTDALGNSNHVIIGMNGSKVTCSSVTDLNKEANVELRKGTRVHWNKMVEIGDMLSGRSLMRRSK